MNLSQLEVFVAITETGSFTEAARRVGVTRSAASHAVAGLEAELGVPLLNRERGAVSPTTFGYAVLQHAREVLAGVEAIQQEAAMMRGLEKGKLRLGLVSSISNVFWGGVLRKFRHEYPGIEVVIFEGAGYEVEAWILNGMVDVGFVLRASSGIDSVLIGHDEVRVVVPAGHMLRRQPTVHLRELAHESFILPKIACDFIGPAWLGVGHVELKHRYEATEVSTILAMVREGLGFTLLPELLLPAQADGIHVLSFDPPLRFNFGVGLRSGRTPSPASQMFVESARVWAETHGCPAQPPEPTPVGE